MVPSEMSEIFLSSVPFGMSQIKNFLNLIDQVTHVLRPGGLLQIMEFDFHSYDENYQRIDPEPSTGTWWSRWLSFCKLAARNAGGDVDAASHMHSWVSQQPAFENLVYKDYWAPISPWRRDSPFQIRVGERMRDDIRVRGTCFVNSHVDIFPSGVFKILPAVTARQRDTRRGCQ